LVKGFAFIGGFTTGALGTVLGAQRSTSPSGSPDAGSPRRRTMLDEGWRFIKGDPPDNSISLLYDVRPQPVARGAQAAAVPATAPEVPIVKSWILPSGNQ